MATSLSRFCLECELLTIDNGGFSIAGEGINQLPVPTASSAHWKSHVVKVCLQRASQGR